MENFLLVLSKPALKYGFVKTNNKLTEKSHFVNCMTCIQQKHSEMQILINTMISPVRCGRLLIVT